MTPRPKLKPRKRPTQERARHTVDAILQAAAYILVERGFEAANTNRIAERAGVNIATLYQYFPGKEAILAELMRRHVVETRAAALEVLRAPRGRGLRALVRAAIDATIAAHRVAPALHRVFTEEGVRLGIPPIETPTDPELASIARAWAAKVRGRTADRERVLWIVNVAVHSVLHAAIVERPEDLDREEFAEELTRLVTAYMRAG
jgi:AcrR family transcriptional regulator